MAKQFMGSLRLAICGIVFSALACASAFGQQRPFSISAETAERMYESGWQAYQNGDWISAYGRLEFYYLLAVNSGRIQRDQAFMQELIAAKYHAYLQLVGWREDRQALVAENRRLRTLAEGDSGQSQGYGMGYKGMTGTRPGPSLRRQPPDL